MRRKNFFLFFFVFFSHLVTKLRRVSIRGEKWVVHIGSPGYYMCKAASCRHKCGSINLYYGIDIHIILSYWVGFRTTWELIRNRNLYTMKSWGKLVDQHSRNNLSYVSFRCNPTKLTFSRILGIFHSTAPCPSRPSPRSACPGWWNPCQPQPCPVVLENFRGGKIWEREYPLTFLQTKFTFGQCRTTRLFFSLGWRYCRYMLQLVL